MKFYISSRVKRKEEVRRVADLLEKKGYKRKVIKTLLIGPSMKDSSPMTVTKKDQKNFL